MPSLEMFDRKTKLKWPIGPRRGVNYGYNYSQRKITVIAKNVSITVLKTYSHAVRCF